MEPGIYYRGSKKRKFVGIHSKISKYVRGRKTEQKGREQRKRRRREKWERVV